MPLSPTTGPEPARPTGPGRALAGALALCLGACGGAGGGGGAGEAGGEAREPAASGTPVAEPAPEPGAVPSIRLVDEAPARGLDHVNASGTPEKDFVLEANGAGVAVLDLAGDGDLDLVFAQGLASLERLVGGPGADLEVFANDGTGHFSAAPGPGLAGWWTGLAAGDVDGDGLADLVAGGFGRLVLLAQGADGTFAPAAEILEPDERWVPGGDLPAGAPPWISSLALFDAEGDGDLDLYAGLYLELDPRHPPRGALGEGPLAVPCRWRGHEVFCGPHGLVPQADRLYLWESATEGGGRFVDASERLDGLVPAYTLAVATLDVEGDGDTDLYVAVDSMPNSLWINEGGRFVDVGWSAGVAVSSDGAPQAGMGVAVGDVDQNGKLDLAVTNFSGETTQLYLGAQHGFDVGTHRYGLQRETRELLSWSAHLVDLDADGWLELFTTNGHVYPEADLPDTGTRYGQPAMLWHLGPEARAARVAAHGEDSLLHPALGARGAAVGDFDLDGAVDLVVSRIDGPAALGMNRTQGAGARVTVRLVDATGADAIGARAVLAVAEGAGERLAVAEVRTAEGYQSASSPWLHFGLGGATRFERVDVRWPSGASETIPGGPAGRMITVREGQGVVAEQAFR